MLAAGRRLELQPLRVRRPDLGDRYPGPPMETEAIQGGAMLTLSRKLNECIMIGDDIEIIVSRIDARQGKVRLSIRAPKDMAIWRKERWQPGKPAGNKEATHEAIP